MSTRPVLEKHVEAKFLKACKARGWLCLKQNVVGRRGYPDRLVIRKDGLHVWVELKREKGVLSDSQKQAISDLTAHSCKVLVCYETVDATIKLIEDYGCIT